MPYVDFDVVVFIDRPHSGRPAAAAALVTSFDCEPEPAARRLARHTPSPLRGAVFAACMS